MEYTENEKKIIDRLNEDIEKTSQERVAELTKISPATLHRLRKGDYNNGNHEAMLKKLANYYGIKEASEAVYAEVEYADTFISQQVYDIIRICHIKGGLAIVCGDAGIGKTKAIKKYSCDYSTNSVVITMHPCLTGTRSLLTEIADKIGADRSSRSVSELWKSIVSKLADRTVLIFDEAQHMNLKNIEILRSFSDYFLDEGQTLGIVFVGNPETVYKMGVKKAEFAQIANRTKQIKIYSVSQIMRKDIEKLFPIIEGHDAEIDFLLKVAKTHQGIRGAVNLFSNAYDNENYTLAGLKAMADFMDIDLNE